MMCWDVLCVVIIGIIFKIKMKNAWPPYISLLCSSYMGIPGYFQSGGEMHCDAWRASWETYSSSFTSDWYNALTVETSSINAKETSPYRNYKTSRNRSVARPPNMLLLPWKRTDNVINNSWPIRRENPHHSTQFFLKNVFIYFLLAWLLDPSS